jgi:adenylate cyclase
VVPFCVFFYLPVDDRVVLNRLNYRGVVGQVYYLPDVFPLTTHGVSIPRRFYHMSYILLVDDDANNLFLLEELLASDGYQTRSATCGQHALDIASAARPDLILLDVMMPDMDGFEVCRRLRCDSSLQVTPIIFLTALDDDESRLKGLELTGDDYLTKPVHSKLLLAKVANMLKLRALRAHQSEIEMRQYFRDQLQQQMSNAWQISESLSETLRRFVPDQFLDRIAPKGLDSIQLGQAIEAEMTVLFCDIREFTAIAESQQAMETFTWLNAFFQRMNDAIVAHNGFIDKYLGDAILAVFERPTDHAQDGLNAAIAMRQTLIEFNASRQQFNLDAPLNIGIGVHSGTGLIGTVGANHRMDSTVIGDVVNTASRLEELTKTYGCQILVSNGAIAHLSTPEAFHVRWIDCVQPRGKRQPVELYEVMGTKQTPIDHDKIAGQSQFSQGIAAWKDEQFAHALGHFEQLITQNPDDSVATLYVKRCQKNLHSDRSADCQPLEQSCS